MRHPLSFALLAALVVAAGCSRPKAEPKSSAPAKVTVAAPVPREVQTYREYNGFVDAVETVSVRPRVGGYLVKVHFKEGAEVEKGAPLYDIDPREYAAEVAKGKADVASAKARLKNAESTERRATATREKGATSEEEFAQITADRESAAAAVDQARATLERAELNLGFTRLAAPIAGRVGRTLVTEGNLLSAATPPELTTIVRMDRMYVYFDVPERNVLEYQREAAEKKWETADTGKIPVEVGLANEAGYPHAGLIDFRDNRVEEGTGTIRLRGVLDNPKRVLVPGLYARVRVPRGTAVRRVLIPEAALLSDQRGRYVWVIDDKNAADYRAVTVGRRIGTFVSIDEGLTEKDRVVVNGLQRVRRGATVEPQVETLKAPEDKGE